MSVQFGIWNQDGQPVDQVRFEKAKALLAPYAPDSCYSYCEASIAMNYQAFHTTKESRRERQPYVSGSGAVITWDGRLDNRQELISQCHDSLLPNATDVEIVAAAYDKWSSDSFGRLVGDWALSIWNPIERSVVLAKDPIGTRHLYYTFEKNQVAWSTILDPLVLLLGKTFDFEEEYIAGWLAFFPATHLTPYVSIHSVPPSCFVVLRAAKHVVHKYWDFDPDKRIRYRTDAEYEEHFRCVLRESVRRRLRSDSPVLAELSGGMDSSSIVCLADTIIAAGSAETPRLDTVSYYNDSEPNWNERPYFTKVEEKRGRLGCHIEVGKQPSACFGSHNGSFIATPSSLGNRSDDVRRQLGAYMTSQGHRVLLSGIGGDEVTGGVPTATSQLAELIARARFKTLARQLKAWALNKRKPWFYLFADAIRAFFPPALVGVSTNRRPAPWLSPSFVERNRASLHGYQSRLKLFGPLPTFQENHATVRSLRRQLSCHALRSDPSLETRYPYLDRTLLEFLYAIPGEQLLRPGHRRSLMRRALAGVVPAEILNRRRKAYVARAPLALISSEWSQLAETTHHMLLSSLGIVDARLFSAALQRARQGEEVPAVALMRTRGIELWLRNLYAWQVCSFQPARPHLTAVLGTASSANRG